MPNLNRRHFLPVAAVGLMSLATPSAAQGARDAGAEQFVQRSAQKVISILADRSMDEAQKEAAFDHAVDDLADVPRITTFVLGKYARSITPEQKARFAPAFRRYAERVYHNRLDEYHGESLRVVGSTVRKPGDVIVATQVTGGKLSQPVNVSWRVLSGPEGWKAVDVEFKGVWLAITEQQDFVSTVDNAHGDIDVLTAQLQRDARAAAGR